MRTSDAHVRTTDLIRVLGELGFMADVARGSHTVFRHADGAVVTVPTDRTEVPEVFIKAVIGQTAARSLASSEEFLRLLEPQRVAGKTVASA